MPKSSFESSNVFFTEKPRVWFSVNKLWRSHSTLIWDFLATRTSWNFHSHSWSPFPHTTHRVIFILNLPIHYTSNWPILTLHTTSTLSPRLQGKSVCTKIQRTVKRTLDSWFQMKASTLLLPFLTYPPWTLPGSWDAQTARQNSPSPCFVQGVVWVGKNISYWKSFPLSVSSW